MNRHLLIIFFISFFTTSHIFASLIKDKISITKSVQEVSFYKTDEGEVRAKLRVVEDVTNDGNESSSFDKFLFFDENTKINVIQRVSKRKNYDIEPIISNYESDGIFHSDLKMCYFKLGLGLQRNEVKYIYEKEYTDLKFFDPIYFHDRYAVDQLEVRVIVPEWMELEVKEFNFKNGQPTSEIKKETGETIYTFTAENIPAFSKVKGAPSVAKTKAHIIIIPKAFTHNGKRKRIMEDLTDLYGWYSSLVSQIDNQPAKINTLVDELIAGKETDKEKIKAIFYWVQDNIRYIAFENGIMGFQPESCQNVFDNKYGDCKGMANLVKQMLIHAGYDARLTWLGTSDIPYTYDMPSLLVDNHMICTVILDGKKIFLDPTEKFAALNNYAFRIQQQQVLIEDGKSYLIETIPAMGYDFSKEKLSNQLSIDGEQLVGSGSVAFSGNRKTTFYNYLNATAITDRKDFLSGYISNNDKNIKIEMTEAPNLDNRDEDLSAAFSIKMDNHIIDLGEELYVNPEFDFQFGNFNIPEKRKVDYEFSGNYTISAKTVIDIPDGWSVQYLPEPLESKTDTYNFELSYQQQANKIIYSKKIAIKETLLKVDEFKNWNKTIDQLKEFYGNQIILEK